MSIIRQNDPVTATYTPFALEIVHINIEAKTLIFLNEKNTEHVPTLLTQNTNLHLAHPNVNPNQKGSGGNTPLHIAADQGHHQVIRALLAHPHIDSDIENHGGYTALHVAARFGTVETVNILLKETNIDPSRPFDTAVSTGRLEIVKAFLTHPKMNPYPQDLYGFTPLYTAALYGQTEILDFLLAHQAMNQDEPHESLEDLLSTAVQHRHTDTVKALLAHKDINPNITNKYGKTPLYMAVKYEDTGIIEALLEHNDIDLDEIHTLLAESIEKENINIVKAFLKCKNIVPLAPFITAIMKGVTSVVEILLARYDITDTTMNISTGFLKKIATEHHALDQFNQFIQMNSPDINHLPNFSFLHLAIAYEHLDIITLLLENQPTLLTKFDNCIDFALAMNLPSTIKHIQSYLEQETDQYSHDCLTMINEKIKQHEILMHKQSRPTAENLLNAKKRLRNISKQKTDESQENRHTPKI